MGIWQSQQTSKEAEYGIILNANNEIEEIPGEEGTDYVSAEHVLRLHVHEWREDSRSFHLGIDKQTPHDDFKVSLDYMNDVLQMSFTMPAEYPGGRIELLRKVRQLLNDSSRLGIKDGSRLSFGITHHWMGADAFVRFNNSMRKASKKIGAIWKLDDWGNEVSLYGCTASWRKKSENSDHVHIKFRVDSGEMVVFTVNTVGSDYRDMRVADLATYIQIMLLPVRIWLRIRFWRDLYLKIHKQKKAKIEALVTAAALQLDPSEPDTAEGQLALKELQELMITTEKKATNDPAADVVARQHYKMQEKDRKAARPGTKGADENQQAESGSILEKAMSSEEDADLGNVKLTPMSRKKQGQKAWRQSKKALKRFNQKEGKRLLKQNANLAEQQLAEAQGKSQELRELSADDKPVALTHPQSITSVKSCPNYPFSDSPEPQSPTESAGFHTPAQSPRLTSTSDSRILSAGDGDIFSAGESESPSHPGKQESTSPSHILSDLAFVPTDRLTTFSEAGKRDSDATLAENIPLPDDTLAENIFLLEDTLAENIVLLEEILPANIPLPADTLPGHIVLPAHTPERNTDIPPEAINQPEETSRQNTSSEDTPPEDTPRGSSQRLSLPVRNISPPTETVTPKALTSTDRSHKLASEKDIIRFTHEISPRSERDTPCLTPELIPVLLCEQPESNDSISELALPSDDTKSDSGSLASTIKASTALVMESAPVVEMHQKGPNYRKNRKKRESKIKNKKALKFSKLDTELSETQENPTKHEEPRQQDVAVQDPAVADASSQHHCQMTLADPTSNPAASLPKKSIMKDKGKAQVSDIRMLDSALGSLDINNPFPAGGSAENLSSDVDQEALGSTPRARRLSHSGLVEADIASSSPESTTSLPGTGKSPMPVIRAMTPSPRTVVPAGHTARGKMPFATPAMTPGPRTEVPAGVLQGGIAVTPAATPSRSAQTPAHAPTSSSSSIETVVAPVKGQFFYDLTYHTWKCALQGCDKHCHYWDGQTVNCPNCGPLSTIVYCGKDHMREDVLWHWPHCGGYSLQRHTKLSSVPDLIKLGPPMIPGINGWDSPERHRQAVWFSSRRENEGDYFIFTDKHEVNSLGHPSGSVEVRCSSRVYLVVHCDEAEKDRFRRVLAVCLMSSVQNTYLVCYLFRLIRDRLRLSGQWSEYVDDMLRYQFRFELGVQVNQLGVGERHACETDWNGLSPRFCRDPVCESERVTLLGDNGCVSRGFARLCDNWESNYWILRANRTAHPTARSVNARICGEGYDLPEEDRRLFRRGEGWDGYQSGPMEIEEQWC
ncbi:uncharacterized protein N7498_009692 [Penicillium cinerascens]|uniref:Uncharacterized protein n=1 Tax=Penicillium cinerascens TaxID=70096 RepID=A0A9W9J6X1_9EURO|nr:uncharacterized protein N7498_009692 [Penicillium cinerascens]KAJ5190707.1 hypothetical protein N7498_009692 [Penicillium cinerascens]